MAYKTYWTYLKFGILFFLILFLWRTCPLAFAALEKSSKKECAMCHVMWLDVFRSEKETLIEWQPGNVLMKDTQGIVSAEEVCYSCHDGYVEDSRYSAWKFNNHPVFKKPSEAVRIPETLTLSYRDELYCGTCHSPHSGGTAGSNGMSDDTIPGPMAFLRLSNRDSALCEACHVNTADYRRTHGHPVHISGSTIPEALIKAGSITAETKEAVICQTCHKVHGAAGRKLTVMDNRQSALCMACHQQRTIAGTQHDLRLTMPAETNMKGQSVTESGPCGACHIPHDSTGFKLLARKLSPDKPISQICLSCHSGNPDTIAKGIGPYSHPNDMVPPSKDDPQYNRSNPTDKLPFYSFAGKEQSEGTIQCFTCHNIHQWDPDSPTNRGGKDVEGDASNSFLRISNNRSSALCVECHRNKQVVLSFDHNLLLTAPTAENIQGSTASASGPCGACHIPHNATGPMLWARELINGKALLPQYCLGCHSNTGAANEKTTGENDHPVDVASRGFQITRPDLIVNELPLFAEDGDMTKGETIRCLTCHDPHIWDPLQPVFSNYQPQGPVEGSGRTRFLRKPNALSSELCVVCHRDKSLVAGTDHDMSVTAPEAKNLLDQTIAESGLCSSCHIAHRSPNDLKLWARPYGPISPENHTMDKLCTSCHSKGNMAEMKVPRIATHPKGKLIENVMRYENETRDYPVDFGKEALIYTPIFDSRGNRVSVGNLSCPSCHNAHQWSSLTKEKGSYLNVEGNAETSFLRTLSYKNICVYCHGQDALFRYRLFHNPDKRSGFKGDETGLDPR